MEKYPIKDKIIPKQIKEHKINQSVQTKMEHNNRPAQSIHPCFKKFVPKLTGEHKVNQSIWTKIELENRPVPMIHPCFKSWKDNPNFNPDGSVKKTPFDDLSFSPTSS